MMTKVQSFQEDCIALANEKLARGQMTRRQFNLAMALLGFGAASGALTDKAWAQAAKEIVFVNWGGIANTAYGNYFGKPFEQSTPGTKVLMDPASPTAGKIRAMVESKKVTWDVCDSAAYTAILLGGQGLLEKIDYNLVKKSDVLPGFAYDYGIAPYSFSNVMIYDSSKFGGDPPKSWADFLDLKKYPGKRMLRRDANAMLESLLMGDGVARDKVYPIDTKRAIEVLKRIRKDAVYWNSGAESEQLMRTGEAVIGVLWNTRAKTKGKLNFTWNQGILQPGVLVVPKGNPSGQLVQQFLAFVCSNVEGQLGLFGFFGNGPSNPRAAAKVSPELRRFNPTDADNVKVQVTYDGEWWGKNYPEANQMYLDTIAG
jgi:putative spermidine/putrescine transport system substrate-binding protein